jgi:hypothetical protein
MAARSSDRLSTHHSKRFLWLPIPEALPVRRLAEFAPGAHLDFATKAIDMPVPEGNGATRRWYAAVSGRAGAAA